MIFIVNMPIASSVTSLAAFSGIYRVSQWTVQNISSPIKLLVVISPSLSPSPVLLLLMRSLLPTKRQKLRRWLQSISLSHPFLRQKQQWYQNTAPFQNWCTNVYKFCFTIFRLLITVSKLPTNARTTLPIIKKYIDLDSSLHLLSRPAHLICPINSATRRARVLWASSQSFCISTWTSCKFTDALRLPESPVWVLRIRVSNDQKLRVGQYVTRVLTHAHASRIG